MTNNLDVSFGTDVPEDVDLDEPMTESSVLDDLKEEVNKGTEGDIKWYPVPEKPNLSLAFNTYIDFDDLNAWFKKAEDGSRREKKTLNQLRLAQIVLSNKNVGIKIKGREATKDGEPLTLATSELHSLFGVRSTQQCIKAIYRKDGHIIGTMAEVLADAGYGDFDLEAEDPLSED